MEDKVTISCRTFVPDVLAEILTRLPANNRRWVRLVCRYWRDVVDTRTATDLRNRAKTLVVTKETAYVFDDLWTGRPRELWARGTAGRYKYMSMVGTCNGIICLCDNRVGAITLINPVTGETLAIPPLPSRYAGGHCKWHQTYSFTYQPTTGRYKIGHIPRYLDRVLVFTLGEASWRNVRMPGRGARCNLDAGIVSAEGYMYFAVGGTKARIMSFDLNNKNFTSVRPLPDIISRPGNWGLMEVHGRLGIAFSHASRTLASTEVWVMEIVAGQFRWNCWYILHVNKAWGCSQCLAWPHFAHSGKHVLTRDHRNALFRHIPSNYTRQARHGVVETDEFNRGRKICSTGPYDDTDEAATATFVYVETTEPLSIYKCW